MRFLSLALSALAVITPSTVYVSGGILGSGNPAYYNPAPVYRRGVTTSGSDSISTWSFATLNNIPQGGSILLTIDTAYETSSIAANTDCIATATGMTPASKTTGYQCTYQTGLLTIKGFSLIPAEQIVTLTVKGINNITPVNPNHPTPTSQIRTIDDQGNLLDYSNTLTSVALLSCTAAGADCSIGTGIPGVFSQLEACIRSNVQIQYCCPKGSHWTGAQYCSYDSVNLNIDPTKVYGAHWSHPGDPAGNVTNIGPLVTNSPFSGQLIPASSYGFGGNFMMQYPSPSTGAIVYPTFQFRFYDDQGALITSSNPSHMTVFPMQGYAAVPAGPDAMYGYTLWDNTNPWTAWLAQAVDFPVGKKFRYNIVITAFADRMQSCPIPVAANSIDVWFTRI